MSEEQTKTQQLDQPPILPLLPILTPAQIRERRTQQLAAKRRAEQERTLVLPVWQETGLPPTTPTVNGQAPAQCRFAESDLIRTPVRVSERAHRLLWAAHHEARLLAQALEEACGLHAHPHVGAVELDIEDDEHHGEVLRIRLLHRTHGTPGAPPPHDIRLPMHDIRLIHGHGGLETGHVPPTPHHAPGEPAFYAAIAATAIAKNYPHRDA